MIGLVLHRISSARDSGLTFSPGAIEINSFSHDVYTKIPLLALHLYVSGEFPLSSMFQLLSIVLEFALLPTTSTPSPIVRLVGLKISEIELLVILTFSRFFPRFIELLSQVPSQFPNRIKMGKLLDIE